MSDNGVNNGVVDETLQFIFEYNRVGGKREELVKSVIQMASVPDVSDKMKFQCLWEIGNNVEMFRIMQEKFQVPSSVLDTMCGVIHHDNDDEDDDEDIDTDNLLFRAIFRCWRDMVEELVKNQGMSLNRWNRWGFTPLMQAVTGQGEVAIASILLNQPNINLELKDRVHKMEGIGFTALQHAASHFTNPTEMVKLLLRNGANPQPEAIDMNDRDILSCLLWREKPTIKNLLMYLVKDVGLPVPEGMSANPWVRMTHPDILAAWEVAKKEPRSLAILARRAVWRVHRVEQLTNEDVPENVRLFLNE